MDILQKHFKKDHVHMRFWTRFYGICIGPDELFYCVGSGPGGELS